MSEAGTARAWKPLDDWDAMCDILRKRAGPLVILHASSHLSATAKLLWIFFVLRGFNKRYSLSDDPADLAVALDVSKRAIISSLRELEKAGWLERFRIGADPRPRYRISIPLWEGPV